MSAIDLNINGGMSYTGCDLEVSPIVGADCFSQAGSYSQVGGGKRRKSKRSRKSRKSKRSIKSRRKMRNRKIKGKCCPCSKECKKCLQNKCRGCNVKCIC